MNTAEWPLAVFTLAIQMAAGMMVLSELARLAAGEAARRLSAGRDAACFVLGAVGMLISLAHLGNPLHSPFAILHVGQSWLSREILCTALFVGTLAALTAIRYVPMVTRIAPVAGRLLPLVTALSCLIGVMTVHAMAGVYMLVTVPAWNSPSTLVNFFGAAVLLGSLGLGVLACLGWNMGGPEQDDVGSRRVVAIILAGVLVGLGLKFIEVPLDLLAGAAQNARGESIVSVLSEIGWPLFVLRLALPVLAVLVSAAVLIPAFKGARTGLSVPSAGVALVFGLAGEILGRLIFYSTHILIGL